MTFTTNLDDQLTPDHDRAEQVTANLLRARKRRGEKRISLALQGGGAFGAFTWGVLDRLLEAKVPFDAVSGASAGAMNAVVLASGLARGGPDHARVGLERFWRKVSKTAERARRSPLVRSGAVLAAIVPRISPYQFNPFDLNPLREILREEVDFEAVQTRAPVRLLIGATRVRDGALRIFRNGAVTPEVVLASSCLPHIHHAVEIDGEPHWDGGYAANPPLMQLVTATRAPDLLVVQVIPTSHAELPTTSPEIDKRIGQITFSNSLQKDLGALSMMTKLSLAEGKASNSSLGRKLQQLQLHLIAAEDHVEGLSEMSVLNAEWSLLSQLRDQGRAAAEDWLD